MKLITPIKEENFLEKTITIELTGREATLINAALWCAVAGDLNASDNPENPRDFTGSEIDRLSNFLDKLPGVVR